MPGRMEPEAVTMFSPVRLLLAAAVFAAMVLPSPARAVMSLGNDFNDPEKCAACHTEIFRLASSLASSQISGVIPGRISGSLCCVSTSRVTRTVPLAMRP